MKQNKKDIRVDKDKAERYGLMQGAIRIRHNSERLSMAKYMQMFKGVGQ